MKLQRRKSLGVVGRDNKNIKGIVLQSSITENYLNTAYTLNTVYAHCHPI